jgi:hypothetical protein
MAFFSDSLNTEAEAG